MPIVETLPGHPGPGPHLLRGGLFFCLFSGGRPPGAVRPGRGLPGRLFSSVACERGAHL
jgi:hypothetical protein